MSTLDERVAPKPHPTGAEAKEGGGQLSQRVRSLRLPQEASGGRSAVNWIAWTLCLVFAASTAVLGYLRLVPQTSTSATKPAEDKAVGVADPAPVAASLAAAPSGRIALESKGYIIPAHQILVSPKVNGMVVKLRITESQRVHKGDVLAELEDTEFRADRDRAKALLESARQTLKEFERGYRPEEVDQARAELAEAEAQRVQLEADYKRTSELFAKRVLSREQYDSALSQYQAKDRHVQRLKLGLKLMEDGPRIERIDVALCRWARPRPNWRRPNGGWRTASSAPRSPARS